jgi:predicted RNase H-like nuclease (RuvC/YqgF family)
MNVLGENNSLVERLQKCEEELENLGKTVEELEKKNEAVVMVINTTNQIFMNLFDRMMTYIQTTISLLEHLPENVAKAAVTQLKKELMETAKMLEKARKNSYVS